MALPASAQPELIKDLPLTDPAVIDLLGLSVTFGRRPILKGLRGDLRGPMALRGSAETQGFVFSPSGCRVADPPNGYQWTP